MLCCGTIRPFHLRGAAVTGGRAQSACTPKASEPDMGPTGWPRPIEAVAVLAQLRVGTIRENTQRGLAYAGPQGRVGGGPSVMTSERVAVATATCCGP